MCKLKLQLILVHFLLVYLLNKGECLSHCVRATFAILLATINVCHFKVHIVLASYYQYVHVFPLPRPDQNDVRVIIANDVSSFKYPQQPPVLGWS